jgi:hypothetical protein
MEGNSFATRIANLLIYHPNRQLNSAKRLPPKMKFSRAKRDVELDLGHTTGLAASTGVPIGPMG